MAAKSWDHEEAYELYREIQRKPIYYAKQAASIRDQYYSSLTYSKNIFIPLTYWCRNNCQYCQFRRLTGVPYLSETEIQNQLDQAKMLKSPEILFTMGEKPEDHYPAARNWLDIHGYSSTIDYLVHVCEMTLNAELLPHSNPGVVTYSELEKLAEVNASMGLMLETFSKRLQLPGYAHASSPTKDPEKRLEVIRNAGKLQIPFTTGILVGIGETSEEMIAGILAIHELSEEYQHIQEVIIQNLVIPEAIEKTSALRSCPPKKFHAAVVLARILLNPEISVQVPPNLNRGFEEQLIALGINDWGGISEFTIDHVNPQASWPEYKHLKKVTEERGFELVERLPVYPKFINSRWLRPGVLPIVRKLQLELEDHLQQPKNHLD
ncbi:MAG: 7,8-didemethyl-8-hydroxy-5-deazariboflavin synthase subunit CofG [Candidatus Hodarchaeota archaeon]